MMTGKKQQNNIAFMVATETTRPGYHEGDVKMNYKWIYLISDPHQDASLLSHHIVE